jgi:hypothetical protein
MSRKIYGCLDIAVAVLWHLEAPCYSLLVVVVVEWEGEIYMS